MIEQVVRHPKTRLNTPHIDLLWIYVWDPITPIEESMSRRAASRIDEMGSGESCLPATLDIFGLLRLTKYYEKIQSTF